MVFWLIGMALGIGVAFLVPVAMGFVFGLWQEKAHLRAIRRANRQEGKKEEWRVLSDLLTFELAEQRESVVDRHNPLNAKSPAEARRLLGESLMSQEPRSFDYNILAQQQAAMGQGALGQAQRNQSVAMEWSIPKSRISPEEQRINEEKMLLEEIRGRSQPYDRMNPLNAKSPAEARRLLGESLISQPPRSFDYNILARQQAAMGQGALGNYQQAGLAVSTCTQNAYYGNGVLKGSGLGEIFGMGKGGA